MKKKRVLKVFVILGVILLLLGGTYLGFFLNGSCGKYKEVAPQDRADWMEMVRGDVLLKDVAIPGSHDAMTTGMYYMACTQNADMEQSLAMGVRYFDFRVNRVDDTLKIYHGIVDGIELEPCLRSARDFLTEHTSETLILDFQHFENSAQQATYEMIHSVFSTAMIVDKRESELSDCRYVASLRVSDVRGKVLILYGDYSYYSMANEKTDIFSRDNDLCTHGDTACISYYDEDLHKQSSEEFIEKCIPEQFFVAKQTEQEGNLALFVLQSQLTDGMLIFGPYAREKSHDENMSNVVKGLYTSSNVQYVNIIMRDFMNVRKCGEIIRLNEAKGTISQEDLATFSTLYSCYA